MRKLIYSAIILVFCFVNTGAFANIATDTSITAAVKMKLLKEKDIPSTDVAVTTDKGIVFLKGSIDTQLQLNRIVEIASATEGVHDVNISKLIVKDSKSFISDAVISSKVLGKISRLAEQGKIANDYFLRIETANDTVHIHGEVSKSGDITLITDAAKDIEGVKAVKTNIKVK